MTDEIALTNEIEEKNIVYPIYIIKHITRYIEDKVDNHIPIKPIYQYLLSDIYIYSNIS